MSSTTTSPVSSPPKPHREPHPLNLPNLLTGLRFLLSIVLFALIVNQEWLWCLAVFVVAAFTDWLDGYLARKLELGSTLGRNLDPLVDKILMCGAFTFLIPVKEAAIHPWIVAVVVSRELAVTSLRSFIENRGGSFGADWLGKIKMVLQCAALVYVFMHLQFAPGLESQDQRDFSAAIRDLAIYGMTAATVLSGLQYLWRATILLRSEVAE